MVTALQVYDAFRNDGHGKILSLMRQVIDQIKYGLMIARDQMLGKIGHFSKIRKVRREHRARRINREDGQIAILALYRHDLFNSDHTAFLFEYLTGPQIHQSSWCPYNNSSVMDYVVIISFEFKSLFFGTRTGNI